MGPKFCVRFQTLTATVWKNSTTAEARFAPIGRTQAAALYHEARRYEGQTRARGKQDGAIGRNGLAILHAMVFDLLEFSTGKLAPSYATIARLANISVRSVARGIAALKRAGVLNWVRRCYWATDSGRLEQDTNAYAILPVSQWRFFRRAAVPPVPEYGRPAPVLEPLAAAAAAMKEGGRLQVQQALDLGRDPLTVAIARVHRMRNSGAS